MEQFKSQGVDLSNILQRPPPADDGSDEPHPALVSRDVSIRYAAHSVLPWVCTLRVILRAMACTRILNVERMHVYSQVSIDAGGQVVMLFEKNTRLVRFLTSRGCFHLSLQRTVVRTSIAIFLPTATF